MILPEHEAVGRLREAGVPVIPLEPAESAEQAQEIARGWGCPVVLKLSSAKHTHKTDVGGIFVHLKSGAEIAEAYEKLEALAAKLDPEAVIIVEPMISGGVEFFLGARRHPAFGPVMSFGWGGIWLELVRDVSFRLLPARRADFEEMVQEVEAWPRLHRGFRGFAPVPLEPLVDVMEKVGGLILNRPRVQELDLNPLMVRGGEVLAVDSRMVLDERVPAF